MIIEKNCTFFYLIFDPVTKLTKIGKSKNPFNRFSRLKTTNPNIQLVYYSNKFTENELHIKYGEKRANGEWFKLTIHDYKEIIGHINGLPKTFYYRGGIPKFISLSSEPLKTIPRKKKYKQDELKIEGRLKTNQNYVLLEDRRLYNLRTGRFIKKTLKGLTPGYWIGKRFIALDKLKHEVELIPKEILPF